MRSDAFLILNVRVEKVRKRIKNFQNTRKLCKFQIAVNQQPSRNYLGCNGRLLTFRTFEMLLQTSMIVLTVHVKMEGIAQMA